MNMPMKASEILYAHGHENVLSTNKTTFEITRETYLTRRGDCIIAVGADKGVADLSLRFKEAAKNERARIKIHIEADREVETINAWGSPQLSFTHLTDFVVRKSDYICGRTLAIHADKVARDLSRKLVEKLRNPQTKIKITLTVESTI